MMDGERLHAAHRRRFWRTLAIAGIGGVPIGFAVGFGAGYTDGDRNAFWTWAPDWLVLLLLAVAVATVLYGSWKFMRSIDEVELQDNLWSSCAAYGAYALLFPSWWALGKAGITGEPNHWMIFFAALGVGLATYLWRKWNAR
jgi:uncharacterized membrane protein YidH (DUF202 family)